MAPNAELPPVPHRPDSPDWECIGEEEGCTVYSGSYPGLPVLAMKGLYLALRLLFPSHSLPPATQPRALPFFGESYVGGVAVLNTTARQDPHTVRPMAAVPTQSPTEVEGMSNQSCIAYGCLHFLWHPLALVPSRCADGSGSLFYFVDVPCEHMSLQYTPIHVHYSLAA